MDDAALHDWWERSGLEPPSGARVVVTGTDPVLDCRHRPGEAAAAALSLGGAWAAELWDRRGGRPQQVAVDVGAAAASLIGFALQSAPGADLARRPPPFTKLHRTADDRWIHLHGGFPHLAGGLVELLGCAPTDEAVRDAVAGHSAFELEDAIAAAGLCGAVARTAEEWSTHPQGAGLDAVGAVTITRIGEAPPRRRPLGEQPLAGVRVADLTRVLAGPACGRTLASHGADVLRIGSPRLPSIEPYVIETGHGKRNAFADLDDPDDRRRLTDLLASADVFCQGYRTGSLAARGLGPDALAELSPGIVVASINCYGHAGPWSTRPGWEQLAQTASGLAVTEGGSERPRLLPAAATDYTTGYLAAAGVMIALARQMDEGGSWLVEASLCQTAGWLRSGGLVDGGVPPAGLGDLSSRMMTTDTVWGPLTHLRPAADLELTPPAWSLPPSPLGSHPLAWAAG